MHTERRTMLESDGREERMPRKKEKGGRRRPKGRKVGGRRGPITYKELVPYKRTEHFRRCLLCKDLMDNIGVADDPHYTAEAGKVIVKHAKAKPSPEAAPCAHAGCVHHQTIDRELALAMIRVGHGDKPWKDANGVKVSNIQLRVKEDDKPEGFEIGKDLTHRHFKHLKAAAGDVFVVLGPKQVKVHVQVDPDFKSVHESVEDPVAVWDLVETYRDRFPKMREWCMKKFEDLKALAELDLQMEAK
jgi:hypothetical protein